MCVGINEIEGISNNENKSDFITISGKKYS